MHGLPKRSFVTPSHDYILTRLRHREPALLIAKVLPPRDGWLQYQSRDVPTWFWTHLLDAGAQAAGLCVSENKLTAPGPRLVASYERVKVVREIAGPVVFLVRAKRQMMGMAVIEVRGVALQTGTQVLSAEVTLAVGGTSP